MTADLILRNVSKHISLSSGETDFFLSLLEEKSLRRKTFHLKAGEVCRYSTFVVEGALKSFSIDKDGDEHVISFALSDWWIADMYSFLSQKPATLTIEAVADSRVLMLSFENRNLLFDKVPKFERFFRIIIENALVANQQRLIDNLSADAEERYLNFLKKYPLIPECVPQHNIASYLGITPEFLSKIRARLAGKK